MRTVLAGTGVEEPTFEEREIDAECPLCGASTAITYEDGWLYRVCTECPGAYEGHDLDRTAVVAFGTDNVSGRGRPSVRE